MGKFGRSFEDSVAAVDTQRKGRFGRTLDDAPPPATAAPAVPEPKPGTEPTWRKRLAGALKSVEDFAAPLEKLNPTRDLPLVSAVTKPLTMPAEIPSALRTVRGAIEESERPGDMLRSGVRGVEQGLTMGYADEILGAVDAATGLDGDKTYEEGRDSWRKTFADTRKAAPVSFETGDAVGSGVRDATVAKALGLAGPVKNVLYGGATGAVEGAGRSEGEGGRLALDATISGALGAATSAVSPQSVEPWRAKMHEWARGKEVAAVKEAVEPLHRERAKIQERLDLSADKKSAALREAEIKGRENAAKANEAESAEATKRLAELVKKKQAREQRIAREKQKYDQKIADGEAQMENLRGADFRSEIDAELAALRKETNRTSAQERRLKELEAEEAAIPGRVAAKRAAEFGAVGGRIRTHEDMAGPLPAELQPLKDKIVDSYRRNTADVIGKDPDVSAAEYEAELRAKVARAREAMTTEAESKSSDRFVENPLEVLGQDRVIEIAKKYGIPPERIGEVLNPPPPKPKSVAKEEELARLRAERDAIGTEPEVTPTFDARRLRQIAENEGLDPSRLPEEGVVDVASELKTPLPLLNPSSNPVNYDVPKILDIVRKDAPKFQKMSELKKRIDDPSWVYEDGRKAMNDAHVRSVLGGDITGVITGGLKGRIYEAYKNPAAKAAIFRSLNDALQRSGDPTTAQKYGAFLATAAAREDTNDILQLLLFAKTDPALAKALSKSDAPTLRR